MFVEKAQVGAHCCDSYPWSDGGTLEQAQALAADGVKCLFGYLGDVTPTRLGFVLSAGMAFIPVTFANRFDGAQAVVQMRALGLPTDTTVFLDYENPQVDVDAVTSSMKNWAAPVVAGGFMPGLYVGSPQLHTSAELFALPFTRYWKGQGSTRDRFGALAEPKCGWCVTQMWPQHVRDGVLVDDDMIGQDYYGRVPNWVRA